MRTRADTPHDLWSLLQRDARRRVDELLDDGVPFTVEEIVRTTLNVHQGPQARAFAQELARDLEEYIRATADE